MGDTVGSGARYSFKYTADSAHDTQDRSSGHEWRPFTLGTAASIGGGMTMGWTMWATLSVETAACRDHTGDLSLLLLGWVAVAGLGLLVRIWVFGFLQ